MFRRDLLKTAALIAGTTALTAHADPQPARSNGVRKQKPRSAYVETRDGTQLFYREWGDGPAVVFMGGWALPSDIWAYQMLPLSESGLRCIAYDRRGHGRSSDPGQGYDCDTLADDLAELLKALDLRETTLVAHSMAGGEVVRCLSRHGAKRIARVCLIGTTLPFLTKTDDNPDGIDPAVFERGRRDVLLKDFPRALADNLRPFVVAETSDAMLEWVRTMMLRTSMQAVVDCNRMLTATDFRAELPRISLPVLLIHGDRDVSAPLQLTANKAKALFGNAQLKVYQGAPHGLMLTHIEQLNQDLRQFIG